MGAGEVVPIRGEVFIHTKCGVSVQELLCFIFHQDPFFCLSWSLSLSLLLSVCMSVCLSTFAKLPYTLIQCQDRRGAYPYFTPQYDLCVLLLGKRSDTHIVCLPMLFQSVFEHFLSVYALRCVITLGRWSAHSRNNSHLGRPTVLGSICIARCYAHNCISVVMKYATLISIEAFPQLYHTVYKCHWLFSCQRVPVCHGVNVATSFQWLGRADEQMTWSWTW